MFLAWFKIPLPIFPEILWKTKETFVTVPGFRVDFWSRDLHITNKECYSLDGNPRALLLMAAHSKCHTLSFQFSNTFLKILFPNSSNLKEQVQRSRCMENVTGRTFWVSIPRRGERYSSSTKGPFWLWSSPSPPFSTWWDKSGLPPFMISWRKGRPPAFIDVQGGDFFKQTLFQKSSRAAQ